MEFSLENLHYSNIFSYFIILIDVGGMAVNVAFCSFIISKSNASMNINNIKYFLINIGVSNIVLSISSLNWDIHEMVLESQEVKGNAHLDLCWNDYNYTLMPSGLFNKTDQETEKLNLIIMPQNCSNQSGLNGVNFPCSYDFDRKNNSPTTSFCSNSQDLNTDDLSHSDQKVNFFPKDTVGNYSSRKVRKRGHSPAVCYATVFSIPMAINVTLLTLSVIALERLMLLKRNKPLSKTFRAAFQKISTIWLFSSCLSVVASLNFLQNFNGICSAATLYSQRKDATVLGILLITLLVIMIVLVVFCMRKLKQFNDDSVDYRMPINIILRRSRFVIKIMLYSTCFYGVVVLLLAFWMLTIGLSGMDIKLMLQYKVFKLPFWMVNVLTFGDPVIYLVCVRSSLARERELIRTHWRNACN